jgi:hypothetical protein
MTLKTARVKYPTGPTALALPFGQWKPRQGRGHWLMDNLTLLLQESFGFYLQKAVSGASIQKG